MESIPSTWNDGRMDEFAGRTEANFAGLRAEASATKTELRDEIHDVRTELRDEIEEVETELKGDIQDLRLEMNGRFSGIERRFDILFGALATGLIGLIVSHLLG